MCVYATMVCLVYAFQNFNKFKWYVLAYFLWNLVLIDFSQGRAEFLMLALTYFILGNRFVYRTTPLFNSTMIIRCHMLSFMGTY